MTKNLLPTILAGLIFLPFTSQAADTQRQTEVARLGSDVMPFRLNATTHIFTKTSDGGTQRVVAKDASDMQQTKLVRQHLRDIQTQFLKGDFSGPSHVHGKRMPGLAELQSATPGQISITYKDVDGGAEIAYRTADAKLVSAIHDWFDAQVSDHGKDAVAGHDGDHAHHSHSSMMQ